MKHSKCSMSEAKRLARQRNLHHLFPPRNTARVCGLWGIWFSDLVLQTQEFHTPLGLLLEYRIHSPALP